MNNDPWPWAGQLESGPAPAGLPGIFLISESVHYVSTDRLSETAALLVRNAAFPNAPILVITLLTLVRPHAGVDRGLTPPRSVLHRLRRGILVLCYGDTHNLPSAELTVEALNAADRRCVR